VLVCAFHGDICILIHGAHNVLDHLLMRLQDGVTPFHWAIRKGSDTIVEILVKAGADVNVADKVRSDFQCLCVRCIAICGFWASYDTHTLLYCLLLYLQDGWTPLRWAIQKGSDNIVEMLVEAGADVNVVDKVGVIFPACMCVPRRLCILIHGIHTILFVACSWYCSTVLRSSTGLSRRATAR
jgi:hypothetical protein